MVPKTIGFANLFFDGEEGVAEVDFYSVASNPLANAQDIPIIINYTHGHYSLISSTQWKH